eukprot:5429596-Lingulodinium_polyedra.AAC.1
MAAHRGRRLGPAERDPLQRGQGGFAWARSGRPRCIGDNLADVLSFDRGRSRDIELLNLKRRAACDIKWKR